MSTSPPAATGVAQEAQALTCARGEWDGRPSRFAFAWLRDGRAIGRVSGETYELVHTDVGHEVACRVTASNDEGSSTATSPPRRVAAGPDCGDVEGCAKPLPTPPPETGPSVKALETALRKQATVRRLRAGTLRAPFRAPSAGTLTVRWSDGAGTVASAHRRFTRPRTSTITLRLTRYGRRFLASGIRGFLTHTEFKLPNGTILQGSSLDGEVSLKP